MNSLDFHGPLTLAPLHWAMRTTLSLLAPALFPSWRFFKDIRPSPRVQWALVDGTPLEWREFRPRPASVSPFQMLLRLFWNPVWNEALYLVSCAERLAERETEHSVREIRVRVGREIGRLSPDAGARQFQFRLVFVERGGDGLRQDILYLSPPFPVVADRGA